MLRTRRQLARRRGLETVEYAAIAGLMVIGCIVTIAVIGFCVHRDFQSAATSQPIKTPDIMPLCAIGIAILGGLMAAFAWSVKKGISRLERAAKLRMLEALSHGCPMSRRELLSLVKKPLLYRIMRDIPSDALAQLVDDGKVVIRDELYSMATASHSARQDGPQGVRSGQGTELGGSS